MPPFNSSSEPPLNFVHLYACCCGNNTEWSILNFPSQNAYALLEDQAVLAYRQKVVTPDNDEAVTAIYNRIVQGYTVASARIHIGGVAHGACRRPARNTSTP